MSDAEIEDLKLRIEKLEEHAKTIEETVRALGQDVTNLKKAVLEIDEYGKILHETKMNL